MKILIAGMMHAGSTRIYNLIRILFEKIGDYTIFATWIDDFDINKEYAEDVIICKAHDYDEKIGDLFDKIILPIRDPRDAVISTEKRFWRRIVNRKISQYIIEMNVNIARYYSWKLRKPNSFTMKYEDYGVENLKDLLTYLEQAEYINLIPCVMEDVSSLNESKLRPNEDDFENEFYRLTLLTSSHNTSNGESRKFLEKFNVIELKTMQKNPTCYNFLFEFGYYMV